MGDSAERQTLLSVLGPDLVRRVARLLAPHGIVVAPLKGVLLQATIYADAAQRPISDVDLLVRPRDWDRARAVLLEHGFRERMPGPRGTAVVYRASHAEIDLDLHRRLFRPGLFRLDTEDVFARATADDAPFGATVCVVHPLDLYAHLVGHFAKSRLGAEDTMHLRDLAETATRFRLDAADAAEHLLRTGLARASRYTLTLAADERGDAFARRVLRALPADTVGEGVARLAIPRMTGPGRHRALWVHALNDSLPRGVVSLGLQGLEVVARPWSKRV